MSRKSQNAFTIIESIMVIVIVGILVALAIPRFQSFYFIKLNGAVKKIVSDIRYVQQLAIARHENYKIVFNVSPADTYTVIRVADATIVQNPFSRQSINPWVDFKTDPQYNGIHISSTAFSSGTLRFDWQGTPQEGPDGAVTDLAQERSVTFEYRGNIMQVYVTPNTGRLRVQ